MLFSFMTDSMSNCTAFYGYTPKSYQIIGSGGFFNEKHDGAIYFCISPQGVL